LSKLYGQTVRELELQRKKTEQEILQTSTLLGQTEKLKVDNLNTINLLQKQLQLRNKLISEIELQISQLENDIERNDLLLSGLHKDLNNLKREYAKLVQFAWRSKTNTDILMFIFASNDFNQAYLRIRFYQQFLKFREKQANEIVQTQNIISSEIVKLQENKVKLRNSRIEKNNEIKNLQTDEKRYALSVKQLQSKENALRKELEERKKAFETLNKAIADLIAEEARKAKAQKADKVRDARYVKLSDGFSGNKGKLPWPTKGGVITGTFGEHNHPVIKGLKIKNNGVDITTSSNAKVYCIFEGEVKKIVSIPGSNTSVLVRHGDYLSVYSNLNKVFVKVGDVIQMGHVIGELYSEKGSDKSIINLQIWKESTMQNPALWILP
jgi:septal ring factor EnvC (AmiA/AmiB activator)